MQKLENNGLQSFETQKAESKKTESTESFGEMAKKKFDQALASVSTVFRETKEATSDASPEEKQQADQINKQASSALTRFYNRVKGLSMAMPLFLFAGDASSVEKQNRDTIQSTSKHIERGNLSASLAFVDTFLSSDLIDTYNQCIDYKEARADGKMSPKEIQFKEEVAQRMYPYDYGSLMSASGVSNIKRLKDIRGGPAKYTKEMMQKKSLEDQVREDLFRKYLGLAQYSDSIQSAEYKPTQAKERQAEYFQFDPQKVLNNIFQTRSLFEKLKRDPMTAETPKSETIDELKYELEGNDFSAIEEYVRNHDRLPYNAYTRQLGEYKAYTGFDKEKNQKYLSYYDLWDIDPPQLTSLGIDVDQFNFPFEIYGRIYESDVATFQANTKEQKKP